MKNCVCFSDTYVRKTDLRVILLHSILQISLITIENENKNYFRVLYRLLFSFYVLLRILRIVKSFLGHGRLRYAKVEKNI